MKYLLPTDKYAEALSGQSPQYRIAFDEAIVRRVTQGVVIDTGHPSRTKLAALHSKAPKPVRKEPGTALAKLIENGTAAKVAEANGHHILAEKMRANGPQWCLEHLEDIERELASVPRDRWPEKCTELAKLAVDSDFGLGDVAARIIADGSFRGKTIAGLVIAEEFGTKEAIAGAFKWWFGAKDCGCGDRKAKLNACYPLK